MPRLRYRAPKSPSSLEARFLMLWNHVKGPDLEREYRFHHERRWRADFAHVGARVLIEIEGGIWVNGRHNRAAGFNADLEKYLAEGLARWRVFRFRPRPPSGRSGYTDGFWNRHYYAFVQSSCLA